MKKHPLTQLLVFTGALFLSVSSLAQKSNLQKIVSASQWDSLFPKRAGTFGTHPQGYTHDFYAHNHLAKALEEMNDYGVLIRRKKSLWGAWITVFRKSSQQSYVYSDVSASWKSNATPENITIVDFADFLNEASSNNNKRELAAFLANISKETTGGWQLPVGSGLPGDYASWGLYFVHELGYNKSNSAGVYSQAHAEYPPNAKVGYYGRGPIQLSWNYNYGQFSKFIYNDKQILLDYPDSLQENGILAFKSAIWFWMMPQCPKPSCHQVMHDQWLHDSAYASSLMYKKGFAHTNNIINGGLECRSNSGSAFTQKVKLRSDLYRYYLAILGFDSSEISKEDTGDYASRCYLSSSNAMTDYVDCQTIDSYYGSFQIDSQVSCGPFRWIDGNTYNRDTSFVFHALAGGNHNKDDSLLMLHLRVLPTAESIDSQTSCGPFTWIDSITYTASTDSALYVLKAAAANGCDSLIRLHLRVLETAQSIDSQTSCGPFTWIDSITYTASTDSALHVLKGAAANGCDSLIRLHLIVLNPAQSIDSQTSCGPYTWIDSITYTASTDSALYVLKAAAANGCDSLIRLHLNIYSPVYGIDSHSACNAFRWMDGLTYTTDNNSAEYVIEGGASNGCDSIVRLQLRIQTVESKIERSDRTLTAKSEKGSYQWGHCEDGFTPIEGAVGRTFMVLNTGAYALELTINGCADTSECMYFDMASLTNLDDPLRTRIFPNPATNELKLMHSHAIKRIEWYNSMGQNVWQTIHNHRHVRLDCSTLMAGSYWVKVHTELGLSIHQVILIK